MTRNSHIFAVLAVATLGAAAPALAQSQLVASAGLTAAEAQGMTLTEIAQYKFNQGVSASDQQAVSIEPGQGGSDRVQLAGTAKVSEDAADSMSLTELAVLAFNAGGGRDAQQTIVYRAPVTVMSRSVDNNSGARRQLIGSAGLTASEAQGMTLDEIARIKFDRDESYSDR